MTSLVHRAQSASAFRKSAAFFLCCLIGGTGFFSVRQSVGENGYPAYLAASIRFSGAGVAYLLVALLTKNLRLTRADTKYLALAGVTSATGHLLLYKASQHLPGGITTVLVATCPMMVAFLAWVTRTENITKGVVLGAGTATLGIGIVFVDRLHVPKEMWALCSVCVATMLSAFCNLFLRRLKSASVPAQGVIFFLAANPVLWCAYFLSGERLPPGPLPLYQTLWLGYTTCFISGVAFALYLWMLMALGLMRTLSCVFFQIIVALGIDAIWENHAPGPLTYAGCFVVVAGVAIEWRMKGRRHHQTLAAVSGVPDPSENGVPTGQHSSVGKSATS